MVRIGQPIYRHRHRVHRVHRHRVPRPDLVAPIAGNFHILGKFGEILHFPIRKLSYFPIKKFPKGEIPHVPSGETPI